MKVERKKSEMEEIEKAGNESKKRKQKTRSDCKCEKNTKKRRLEVDGEK